MPESEVRVGAVLAGKYRVERVLGQGGMGVVVEATQLDLDRPVALKFLRARVEARGNEALTRFEREARTIARLRGPHIVQVYDVGRLDHGEPFIVMELLSGEDLSALLDREKRLAVPAAVDYVLQACEAMAEAHVAGVVHRDLKPANLFLSRRADGRPLVKVLDFGISKLMAETTSLNLTSGALGSPLYMSPEQLSSAKDIDHRTDVWSLGAILYELLSGKAAFDAEGLPQICAKIVLGAAEPIRTWQPELPAELEMVLTRCLRRYPDERFLSVADLAAALMPFARKGSLASAEAAIRIIQASRLLHGPLPRVADSLAPPPLDATKVSPTLGTDQTVFSGPPSSVLEAPATGAGSPTVNVSGAPAAATQAELRPLVSATRPIEPQGRDVSRALLWGVLGILSVLLLLIVVVLVRSHGTEVAASAAAPDRSAPATPANSVAFSPTPAATALSAVTTSAVTTSVLPEPVPAPSVAVKSVAAKPRPKRPSPKSEPATSDPENLLNHR